LKTTRPAIICGSLFHLTHCFGFARHLSLRLLQPAPFDLLIISEVITLAAMPARVKAPVMRLIIGVRAGLCNGWQALTGGSSSSDWTII